jgi:hypothetical protein
MYIKPTIRPGNLRKGSIIKSFYYICSANLCPEFTSLRLRKVYKVTSIDTKGQVKSLALLSREIIMSLDSKSLTALQFRTLWGQPAGLLGGEGGLQGRQKPFCQTKRRSARCWPTMCGSLGTGRMGHSTSMQLHPCIPNLQGYCFGLPELANLLIINLRTK